MSLHNLKKTFAAHCVHKLISQILGMAGSAITTSFIKPTKNWMIFYLILLLLLLCVLLHKYFYYTTKYYYNPPPEQLPFWVTFRKKICFFKEKKMRISWGCVSQIKSQPLKQNVGLLAMLYKILYYPTTKYYTTHHDIYYYLWSLPPEKEM